MKEVESEFKAEMLEEGEEGRGERRGGDDGGENELSRKDWKRVREPANRHANKFTTEARGKSLGG